MYGVEGKKFQRQYKNKISDYKSWKHKAHAQEWLIYPENISQTLSIDEVALSGGELYTVVTSKKAKGKKGCLVAIVKETRSETVIEQLLKIDRRLRLNVKEITLDMAGSMKRIAKRCFPNAKRTVDRATRLRGPAGNPRQTPVAGPRAGKQRDIECEEK